MSTSPRNPFAAHDPYAAATSTATATPATTVAAGPAAAAAGPGAPAALVIDVSEADFEQQVLERSLDVPVLLDCWAPWCGPCRSLGPILERLAQAYGGRFVLAKINTDEAPNLSAALRIRSIPLVVLFAGGRPVDQFVGALPEGQIRQFLDKHLDQFAPQASPLDELRQAAAAALAEGHADEAEQLLQEALAIDPAHAETRLDLAERQIARGELDTAAELLARVAPEARAERHAALEKRIEMARHKPAGDPVQLRARIGANAKDFEARFGLAALLAHDGDFDAAFEQLLEVVLRDKGEQREAARQKLVEWFAICPDAEAVSRGRRYLGMYLN
ncbi:MAG: tetratricopeptide repeat protein [Proteobacteria bacterium]|nr:tetratricopeptide repeat protein [Pseudomonadota bacterium]